MNPRRSCFLMAALTICVLAPTPRSEAGMLEWISQLSGPEMLSYVHWKDYCLGEVDPEIADRLEHGGRGWRACHEGRSIRQYFGLGLAIGKEPPGSQGSILMLQLGSSYVWKHKLADGPRFLAGDLGYRGYLFHGSGFQDFSRFALTGGLSLGFPLASERLWKAYIGPRVWWFPERFLSQDFGGVPEAPQSGGELSWGLELVLTFK